MTLVCTACWEAVGDVGWLPDDMDGEFAELLLNIETERHIAEAHPGLSPKMMLSLSDGSTHYIEAEL